MSKAAAPPDIAERYQRQTINEIAEELHRDPKTVARWLRELGITRRASHSIKGKKYSGKHPGEARLRDMYVSQKLSTRQIAALLDVSSNTAAAWCREIGVTMRTAAECFAGIAPSPQAIAASVAARRKHILPNRHGGVGYKMRTDGYVYILRPEHPGATKDGYVLEHRLVAEQLLGRSLRADEDAHHKNGVRHDNRPENIEVLQHSQHIKHHYQEREIEKYTGRFLKKK